MKIFLNLAPSKNVLIYHKGNKYADVTDKTHNDITSY